jgi:hypothetical protein
MAVVSFFVVASGGAALAYNSNFLDIIKSYIVAGKETVTEGESDDAAAADGQSASASASASGPGPPLSSGTGTALGSFLPEVKDKHPWNIMWFDSDTTKLLSPADGGSSVQILFKAKQRGSKSGHGFRANPLKKLPADEASLSYDVYFPTDFQWGGTAHGGKLPGFCIGTNQKDAVHACATGCDWKPDAGSVRLMWRENGTAVVYVYIPTQTRSTGNSGVDGIGVHGTQYKAAVHTTGGCGNDLWRKVDVVQFKKGSWNSVTLHVRLNTPGQSNGGISVTVNGKTREVRDVMFRTSADVKITAAYFSTFFGGGDTYAPTKDVTAKFANFKFWAP